MDRQTRIATALERLFRTYQQLGAGEEALRDRIERAKVYFDAVAPYEIVDIEQAVANFLSGSAPGVNPSFQPPAPAVGSECRRCMNLRLDSEHRMKPPALPPPDIEKSPESRARVKAKVAELIGKFSEQHRTEDAATAKRAADLQKRVDERFSPDPSPAATLQRLGFEAGDRDGHEDAA